MHKRGVASLQPSFRRLRPAPHIPSGHLTTAMPRGRAGNSGSSPDAPVLARTFNSPAGPLLVGISGPGKRSFPLSSFPHRALARAPQSVRPTQIRIGGVPLHVFPTLLPLQMRGLYRLQPPAARSVAATDVTSVYQTDVTSAAPTDTLCLCSNVSVGPADIKSVWATDVTSVASGRRYRGGL
ncbi:hypothetical protein PCASD_13251 [Puccinia coronata f. sp. avenae]|uniref:Uncharacterized protein n=1 Tax=Puccinia coronata f. sp. avenae TaxID=200324 RepID=A0A2N5UGA2_9BASI|nr:hypothetical protein PCASD_13251 [Puccinia coronata f. sp. avenae]